MSRHLLFRGAEAPISSGQADGGGTHPGSSRVHGMCVRGRCRGNGCINEAWDDDDRSGPDRPPTDGPPQRLELRDRGVRAPRTGNFSKQLGLCLGHDSSLLSGLSPTTGRSNFVVATGGQSVQDTVSVAKTAGLARTAVGATQSAKAPRCIRQVVVGAIRDDPGIRRDGGHHRRCRRHQDPLFESRECQPSLSNRDADRERDCDDERVRRSVLPTAGSGRRDACVHGNRQPMSGPVRTPPHVDPDRAPSATLLTGDLRPSAPAGPADGTADDAANDAAGDAVVPRPACWYDARHAPTPPCEPLDSRRWS